MGSVAITCCSTNEEKVEEVNKPEMEHQPIIYTYPYQDVKPIQYFPRTASSTTLNANNN